MKRIKNMYDVAFFPYLNLTETIQFGNYEIWPYYLQRINRIDQKSIVRQLDKYFKRYFERTIDSKSRKYKDLPIDTINIVTPTNFMIGKNSLSEEQYLEIWKVRNIIAFSAMTEHTYLFSSTDSLSMVIQKFKEGEEGVYLYSTYVSKYNILKFLKPYNINSYFEDFRITDFNKALGEIIHEEDELSKRIFECLNVYFYANSQNEMITIPLKILSIMMSLEVLLNFNNKFELANTALGYLPDYEQIEETRTLRINKKGKYEETEFTKSRTWWWLFDIYNLRSNIVHGKDFAWDAKKNGSINVITRFSGFLIRRIIWEILYSKGMIQSDFFLTSIERSNPDKQLESYITYENRLDED